MDHVDAAVGQAGPRMSGLLTSLAEQGSGMVGRAFERAQRIQAVAAGAAVTGGHPRRGARSQREQHASGSHKRRDSQGAQVVP